MITDATTGLLVAGWNVGDENARDALIRRLHPELAQIAAARLRGEYNTSLSTGDLINDAVVRLLAATGLKMNDRVHFIALASRLMRNILVDHARARHSDKRRGVKIQLCTNVEGEQRFDLRRLDSALIRLGAIDAQLMQLVEMRYFGGMTFPDVATVLDLSERTVKRRWQAARAWLADALGNPIDHD